MIDYKIIAHSTEFYEEKGFKRIDAPWLATENVTRITAPGGVIMNRLVHNNKCLVASGEQSFLYMMVKSQLPPGSYQTVTPCFRDEHVDPFHLKSFLKNELIITSDVSRNSLAKCINAAREFFTMYCGNVTEEETEDGYDLFANGVEIGSYGIRQYEHLKWVYGTGVAEPRFSNVLKMFN
jgi:aspartyl/asparaginyl-tRNA synthetase